MKNDANEALDYISFLTRHIERDNIPAATMLVLMDLKIPYGSIGFDHLETGIVAFSKDSVRTLAAGIYETIIASCDIKLTKEAVEQAIRAAISSAWKIKNIDVWIRYFSQNICATMKKPTNTEFITRLGRYLRLWRACYKEGTYDGK